ncbi:MAG: Uma2 family endonuclease [Burkholderiales bacterium]|nr:Uma2 family endonuclease [Burkholderiales bacterium]MCW5622198.1 Uma2 family endonuclease [Burkholderiales bacterium]
MAGLSVHEEREGYLARHRITVDEYHRMGQAGVLPPDARLELFEGELIDMAPIGPAHANAVDHLVTLFAPLVHSVIVRVQNPLRLGSRSELLPDLMLLQRKPGGYPQAAPDPSDVLLLIEVSDTSIGYDREHKLRLYARYGVAETWLVDLNARQLEIHLDPSADGYRKVLKPAADSTVTPSLVDEFSVPAGAVFPG